MGKVKKVKKTITLQTRGVDVEVKEQAEEYARSKGFNSLQDAVRLYVHLLAGKEIDFTIGQVTEDQKILIKKMIEAQRKELSEQAS